MKQVITIASNGIISGLQRKPGQGINLQQFGPARTTRASEIVWDEDQQLWFVDILQEAGRGKLTPKRWQDEGLRFESIACEFATGDAFNTDPIFFRSYDEAVGAEIMFLDALRLKGIH